MSINFLSDYCRTITDEKMFGICDNDDKTPAYIELADENNWIATVVNNTSKQITFRAIDNCIEVLRENGEMDNRCDVMMAYDGTIVFVELKNKHSDWKSDGIKQIEATLIRFIENHPDYYYGFKKKKAFVANRRHPNFHKVEDETMLRFFKEYKIRLDIQAEIIIK